MSSEFSSGQSDLSKLSNLSNCEVHVLVHPNQELQLESHMAGIRQEFPSLHKAKVMATATSTGVAPRQPMVSGFMISCTPAEAKELADQLVLYLSDRGLNVIRSKVEVLVTLEKLDGGEAVSGDDYYEAHIKVGSSMPSPDDYHRLAELCLGHGTQLLLNPYSIKMAPVTTMRSYDCTADEFSRRHQALLDDLTKAGFQQYKVHMERGVYDSNPFTDQGWLFHGTCYKSSITTLDVPERLMVPVTPLIRLV